MTALAGLWYYGNRPDLESNCAKMLASQAIYGPDASAQWSSNEVALGRQLMRLLPEDVYDRQPLHGGGGRYVLVADLRLDNREELAPLLDISSEQSAHFSDAAFLLAAIEKWGEHCVERIVGDYAFVLWDNAERHFLLARDPQGQRPLLYHCGKDFFAVASMSKGLHALDFVPYELDEDNFVESFWPMPVTHTGTFYRGVERVLPGHLVTVTKDSVRARRHWNPRPRQLKLKTTEEYHEALRHVLDQAVQCRLRSTNPLIGAELSGGLDSSAVAATAARLMGRIGGRVVAFTAVPRKDYNGPLPRNRFADERQHASETAAMYPNMEHVLVHSEGISPLDSLDRAFYLFGGPSRALCSIPWVHQLFNVARDRKTTVLLHGAAGNLGISYSGIGLLPELFRTGRWSYLWREIGALIAKREMRWRGALAQTFGPWCPLPVWTSVHRMISGRSLEPTAYSPVNPKRFAELRLRKRAREHGVDLHYRPWRDSRAARLFYWQTSDSGSSNKGILAGWRIDHRDPTADVRLLEFCLSVPTEQFLQNGTQRALARGALSDRLPRAVLDERRRGLQAADWHEVMSADRERISAELTRLESCPAAKRTFDLPRLKKLVEDWPKEGWDDAEVVTSYRLALANAISTGHFVRRVTGSNA